MNPRRWSLRLRVTIAFLATSAFALLGLGAFVVVGVRNALEERLVDSVEAEADRLAELSPDQRPMAVVRPPGEIVAQVMTTDGRVLATSGPVIGRLLPANWTGDDALIQRTIRIRDDDEVETVAAIMLVRRAGDQILVVAEPRDDVDETLTVVRATLLVGGLAALAVAGVLGYLVAGAGLRPIERMRERAATISDRSAGERLPLPAADDELRRLAETLNAMLGRLDDGLERQRRFVAEASHELRTPLALMRTEIELALARPRNEDELRAALRSADEETQRLIALADRLLLLAAADAGRLTLDKAAVDVSALAHSVVERFEPRARELGRELRVSSEPGEVMFNGDAGRLDQAVSNLVDNALRHGEGTVTVELRRDAAGVVLVVADAGSGITDARPFERFSGSSSGAGLGLAIVQEIVRAHGGNVTVDAGDRARIVLTLPDDSRD